MTESGTGRIARYEILEELGQGAMGIVYKARDPQLDRIVAIKTLRRDLGLPPEQYAELKRRFYQEATAAGRLNHPNLVSVYDVVEVDGVPYMVMEYLEGRTLADLIASEGPLRPRQATHLVSQVCSALEYAHAHGVVHRDIKPGNILVGADGVAKVSDFGIARISGSTVTRTGVMVGTPAYMSPEQLSGRGVDGRSDLFSLGVALYEALTGVNPFQADDLAALLYRVVHVDPPPARQRNPKVPPALDAVMARVLAKVPDQRYPNARAFAEALAQAVGQPTGARTARLLRTAFASSRAGARSRALLIGAVCLLVASVGGWAFFGRETGQHSPLGSRDSGPKRESQPDSGGEPVQSPPPAASPVVLAPAAPEPSRQAPSPGKPWEVPHDTSRETPPDKPRSPRAAAPSGASGCLSVNAIPFASVYVDGQYVGDTPRACLRIPVGERRIHFEATGERSPERRVQVTEQHTAADPLHLSYDFRSRTFIEP
ncbi:MAG: protein kinase [Candidatus Rokubacteria bacterium]|nr:protein kinase [Candidatus Rokubacteria bacterium]